MNSFLNRFVSDMNSIISLIWSYDLEILPCMIGEGNDLDYKFRVKVNNSETVEDVSKVGSSMHEMINLAFRIVFTKYMGIQDTPLILDEFGRTFDDEHRRKAYRVVNDIFTSMFNQIFIVSHFESMYGSLSNTDLNVLSSNNLDIDKKKISNNVFKIE